MTKREERKALKETVKGIKSGVRLNTKAPQIFADKSKYSRKRKHREFIKW